MYIINNEILQFTLRWFRTSEIGWYLETTYPTLNSQFYNLFKKEKKKSQIKKKERENRKHMQALNEQTMHAGVKTRIEQINK